MLATGLLLRALCVLCGSLPAGTGLSPLAPLVRLLAESDDSVVQRDILRGMHDALVGRKVVAMPEGWPAVYRKLSASADAEVREKAMLLAVLFNDQEAMTALRKLVTDAQSPAASRATALQALLYKQNPDLVPILHALLSDKAVRGPALRGLAAYSSEATPREVLRHFAAFTEEEKADAIHTLASRPAYALALLDAVEQGQVPRRELGAFTVRQLLGLKDKRVAERVNQVWGVLRPASAEKGPLMARYKTLLTPDYLQSADKPNGRVLFNRNCASCHVLFGEGGRIGPELTGSQRNNLDYVLENILDPSAVVPKEYQVTFVHTNNGRVVTGIIQSEDDKLVVVQTQNERVRMLKSDIAERVPSKVSMMPEGLLAKLKDEEVRDLIAYLASRTQVPLPEK